MGSVFSLLDLCWIVMIMVVMMMLIGDVFVAHFSVFNSNTVNWHLHHMFIGATDDGHIGICEGFNYDDADNDDVKYCSVILGHEML